MTLRSSSLVSSLITVMTVSAVLAGCSSSSKKSDSSAVDNSQSSAVDVAGESDAKGAATSENVAAGRDLDKKYQPMATALRAGQLDTVTAEAAKLLMVNANDPVALNALAIAHFRRGHIGAAKIFLNRAIEKNPPSAGLFNNLGVLLLEDGDAGGAITSFKKALRVNDQQPEALANLGGIYAQGGDFTRALPLLTQAYQMNSANSAVANNLAVALRSSGDLQGAKKIYVALLARNSRDVNALINSATLLIDYMNQPKDGLALVYKVKFLETDRKDVLARANALEKKAKAALE